MLVYCRRIKGKTNRLVFNTTGKIPKKPPLLIPNHISRQDFLKHIWSEKEISEKDMEYLLIQYPLLNEIIKCIKDFRDIYKSKGIDLLH